MTGVAIVHAVQDDIDVTDIVREYGVDWTRLTGPLWLTYTYGTGHSTDDEGTDIAVPLTWSVVLSVGESLELPDLDASDVVVG